MQTISAKKVTPSIKRRRDDHRRLDVSGHFGLPGHALDGRAADASDAQTGADDDQARAECAAEGDQRALLSDCRLALIGRLFLG